MTNLEWKNNIGMIAENAVVKNGVEVGVNLVIALRDSDYDNYKKLGFDWLFQEHKESIKLKRWEKDLLKSFGDVASHYKFDYFPSLREMKHMGYFEGVKDTSMELGDILGNCEVVE